MPRKRADDDAAWAGVGALDRLLEHRTRLGACVLLSRGERLSFVRLKELLEETDGNLGAHLRKLEQAGYVDVSKEFVERRPVTWYALSSKGRQSLKVHLDGLKRLIGEARAR